jgi:predicted CXXCH cytochrome family protein
VDAQACAGCHADHWQRWSGSHHDLAMQPATAETVLGDFEDAAFEQGGVTTRFFRRGEAFVVNTEGADGRLADFEVRYTFGVEPLQQYLIEFPGGRMQCLTIAWDTERGRWFSLYPDEVIPHDDPLHWTGRYQRWNSMCADCHSTDLRKNYDPATDTYATTWHEINVGCQACHGPGSEHVRLAEADEGSERTPEPGYGFEAPLRRGELAGQVDACAPCHSRRAALNPERRHGEPFLGDYLPERLHAGSYHADGQILDEVYVWGSFAQSKMYQAGVACTDCHDPHSLELQREGDGVCMQCHADPAPTERFPTLRPKKYDTPEHHGHPLESEGARCVNCHMRERTYMVVDPRRDHSMRVPRPDLTAELGVPNACGDCHADQTPTWAAERIAEWSGGAEPPPHFATAFARARAGDPDAWPGLVAIAEDREQPAIVRATALDHLGRYRVSPATFEAALRDPDPLVRVAALGGVEGWNPGGGRPAGGGVPFGADALLHDPLRSVRGEAARILEGGLLRTVPSLFDEATRAAFDGALADYEAAQLLAADFPTGHLNLALLAEARGDVATAEVEYRAALTQQPSFLPARFNLANLLNRIERNAGAEVVLREGLSLAPEEGELHYSLGLLLSEMGRAELAAEALRNAARLLPGRARVHYNAGLALEGLDRLAEAQQLLDTAHALDASDPDVRLALLRLALRRGDEAAALVQAVELAPLLPQGGTPQQLVERVRAEL